MRNRVLVVMAVVVVGVLACALLLPRCSSGSSGSSGSSVSSIASAVPTVEQSQDASATPSLDPPATSPTLSTKDCMTSLQNGGKVEVTDPNVVHQHWFGSGLTGCSKVTLNFGNMSLKVTCATASFAVHDGSFDGYVDFNEPSCPKFAETNVQFE